VVEINGVNYSPLIENDNFDEPVAFIREEENKVFILPTDTSENEILLYDFNLEVGDIYETNWSYFYGYDETFRLEVKYIDSIEIKDGSFRKSWYLSNDTTAADIHWIEGIGDQSWLFYQPAYLLSVSNYFELTCQVVDGNLLYDPSMNLFCQSVGVEDQQNLTAFQAAPNPFDNRVKISSENAEIKKATLLDINGASILEVNFPKLSSDLILDTSLIDGGVYFLILVDGQDEVTYLKLFKI